MLAISCTILFTQTLNVSVDDEPADILSLAGEFLAMWEEPLEQEPEQRQGPEQENPSLVCSL